MSNGSLKDLTKAISIFISSTTTPVLPLPDDLVEIIQAYLEKYSTHEETDCQRLHEDLLAIYQSNVPDTPPRIGPFLAVLRMLMGALSGSGRHLQWWDTLSETVLSHLGDEKGLAAEARYTLLDLLVYDEDSDDEALEDAAQTTSVIAEHLLAMWLLKSRDATNFDDEAHFIEGQIQLILLAFGKKRPKDFLNTINRFFIRPDSRILVLSLLCEFIRHQPPHLHKLLQTPLFDNLLRCLQIDTSTRVISLAMTALVMFLPHIPSSLATHLPALFNIYTRMLFWDRERRAESTEDHDDWAEKTEGITSTANGNEDKWEKLAYLLESEDETVPELLHYFTFLYGLYPINFMSYIRKPQRYLRHANFPGANDLNIQPTEMRQRSEPFRTVHLLHPNFFHMTIESELTDNNRWIKSDPADVVAECMALYSIGEERFYQTRSPNPAETSNVDVPEGSLFENDASPGPTSSAHVSWRDTQSTAVNSVPNHSHHNSNATGTTLDRKPSQRSQSIVSLAETRSVGSGTRIDIIHDSPTTPAHLTTSSSHNQLQDLLHSKRSTRGSVYQALTNDSVQSLSLIHSHESSTSVDAYIASLAREPAPRSPSLRPAGGTSETKMAYLNREIMLLRNDLNFERYLKQQHLSHIGQLRRKQIREARVEAETQNLINTNKGLKNRIEESKRILTQVKKETEMSKSHSRKWESDLSTKLKALREEQRRCNRGRAQLQQDLDTAREENNSYQQIVLESEARELNAKQKLQNIESSLHELIELRAKVESLSKSIRDYETAEYETVKIKESGEAAESDLAMLKMRMAAKDMEDIQCRRVLEDEVDVLKEQLAKVQREEKAHRITNEMIESAMAASRKRIHEMEKAHGQLLDRYTSLHASYLELMEQDDQPLLSSSNPIPSRLVDVPRNIHSSPSEHSQNRHHAASSSDPDNSTSSRVNNLAHIPHNASARPWKIDPALRTSSTPTESQSPSNSLHSPPQIGGRVGGTDVESIERGGSKAGIKAQSDARIFGRGGVQNISKKEKGKEKEHGTSSTGSPGGSSNHDKKKAIGLRGIRGLGGL